VASGGGDRLPKHPLTTPQQEILLPRSGLWRSSDRPTPPTQQIWATLKFALHDETMDERAKGPIQLFSWPGPLAPRSGVTSKGLALRLVGSVLIILKTVTAIDYLSKKDETVAAPFCVAITVEEK
jgi:hypothetical protein